MGRYTRQVLANLSTDATYGSSFQAAVLANVRSEELNVRQVFAKVVLGEADAAFVYASDVGTSTADVVTIEIPEQSNVAAAYPIALLAASKEKALARSFITFVRVTGCAGDFAAGRSASGGRTMSRVPSPPSFSRNRRKVSPHTVGSEAGLRSLFLVPALLFAAFIALPLLALILRAAMTGNLLQQLAQPIVLSALRLSALTSLASLLIIVLVGTPTAYLLARSTFPGKRLLDVFIDVPLALPPVVVGVALLLVFGRLGVLGQWLQPLGIEIAFTTLAVVLAQVFVAAPFYVRSAKIGFARVDPELEEIAVTLGASTWQDVALRHRAAGVARACGRCCVELGAGAGRVWRYYHVRR